MPRLGLSLPASPVANSYPHLRCSGELIGVYYRQYVANYLLPKGGENMTKLKVIALSLLLAMAVVPAVANAGDPIFGLDYGTATGLGQKDVRQTVADIIRVALSLLGIVALVIILIGGFKWMTAGGAEEKVTEARKMIFSGIIGLAVLLSAYAITRFVLSQLAKATDIGQGSGQVL